MKFPALLFFTLFALSGISEAADWFVTQAGGGTTKNGKSWSNAWTMTLLNSNQSSLVPGDTVWIAGGTYGPLTITKSGSAANGVISFKRVRSSDSIPVASPGWSSSFDSQVNFGTSMIDIEANYITIDGRVVDGMWQKYTKGGDGMRMARSAGGDHNTIKYFSSIGPYSIHGAPAGYGINFVQGGLITNLLMDHCTVRGWCEDFRASNWNGVVIQYCNIGDTYNDSVDHEDTCYSYFAKNVIWRYNNIYNSPNDGFFFEMGSGPQNTNWYFYGNYVYNYNGWLICTKYDASSNKPGPMYIYNNVFQCPDTGGNTWISNNTCQLAPTTYIYNNIFINATNQMSGYANCVSDYNAYSTGAGKPSGEGSHSFTFTYNANQFVRVAPPPAGGISENPNVGDAGGDFHLTTAGKTLFQGKGTAISTADGYINYDADGKSRGGTSGSWDVGAFVASTGSTGPASTGPAFVQKASQLTSGATSVAVALPSNVASGDLLVVGVKAATGTYSISSITDARGSTWTADASKQYFNRKAWVRHAPLVSSGAETVTVKFSGSVAAEVVVYEFSGLASKALDVSSVNANVSTAVTSTHASTTVANDVVFGFAYIDSGLKNGESGWTTYGSPGTPGGNLAQYVIKSAKGSYESTGNLSSSVGWISILCAYK